MEQFEAGNPCHRVLAIPEMFLEIMKRLEVREQVIVKRVCTSWKIKIDDLIKNSGPISCLMLNVKKLDQFGQDPRAVQSWAPKASIAQMQFEFAYKKPEKASSRPARITIIDRVLNRKLAKPLRCLFSQVRTLIVYWDTEDSKEIMKNFVEFVQLAFNRLTSLGFIMSGQMRYTRTFNTLIRMINAKESPLEQLHLMMQNGVGRAPVEVRPYIREFDEATETVTNFSMTGRWHSSLSYTYNVDNVGAKADTPLHSLSLNTQVAIHYSDEFMIIARDKFISVTRLQLTELNSLNDLRRAIHYFSNVEQLHLTYFSPFKQTFEFEWIRLLKGLKKLTELTLINFRLDYLAYRCTRGQLNALQSFDQLQKLTVAAPDLFYYFQLGNLIPFLPGLKARHIAHTIGRQFPGLRELNLWSGDSYLNQTALDTSWKTVEQNINRELPTILPGLKVDVKLRHPVMYNLYLRLPAEYRQEKIDSIAKLHANRMNVCNQLIRHMSDREYDVDYVTSLLNGNVDTNIEQDNQTFLKLIDAYGHFSNTVGRR